MQVSAGSQFAASYDRTTKIVSPVVCAILLLVAAVVPNLYLASISPLIILVAYAYSVRSYAVAEGAIVVRRLAGNVRVPLQEFREARRAGPDDFQGCLRLWGSGGLFGYYGLFRTARLGRCTWYVTDRKNSVVVRTGSKTLLYSPDDVDGFLRAIGFASTPGAAEVQFYTGGSGSLAASKGLGAMGILVAVASVTLVVMTSRYSPGPPGYTLTPSALAIHDRFYPVTVGAQAVDTAGIRSVDLTQESGWRPVTRTGGFSNEHYRSGWFRVANGQRVRLYWANSTRVVLLPPRGNDAPVLLEVADSDAFVAQIRREWAGR